MGQSPTSSMFNTARYFTPGNVSAILQISLSSVCLPVRARIDKSTRVVLWKCVIQVDTNSASMPTVYGEADESEAFARGLVVLGDAKDLGLIAHNCPVHSCTGILPDGRIHHLQISTSGATTQSQTGQSLPPFAVLGYAETRPSTIRVQS